MIDMETRENLLVHTEGSAGPYIMVPVSQVEAVQDLLQSHRIAFWTDEDVISMDGRPEVAIINLGSSADAEHVQRILNDAS